MASGIPLDLRPTNIRSSPGFLVIGRVNYYLVEIQASQRPLLLSSRNPRLQCLLPLSGCNPGFVMYYTIIWSNPGFMVSYTAIWSIPGFTITCQGFNYFSGRSPGFIVWWRKNQDIIRSNLGFNFNLRPTNIWSIPGFLVIGRVNYYLVEFRAS